MRRLLALGALLLVLGPVARADSVHGHPERRPRRSDNATGIRDANNGVAVLTGVYAGSFYVTDSAYPGQAFIAFAAMWGSSTSPAAGQGELQRNPQHRRCRQPARLPDHTDRGPGRGGGRPHECRGRRDPARDLATDEHSLNASSVTSDQTVLGFVNDIDHASWTVLTR